MNRLLLASAAVSGLSFSLLLEAPQESSPPARALAQELCSFRRLAGTRGSMDGARFVERVLLDAGFEVELDSRTVLLSLPRKVSLVGASARGTGNLLFERSASFTPDSEDPGDVPPFNAWAKSGSASGEVVFVGRGLRADYERLAADGVDVQGAIALAEYGGAYRGVKVDLASQFGCAGVLLFSATTDDGAAKGATWPDGPWKPDWAVQRGSVSPMGRTPGDPSTPGWASPGLEEDMTHRIKGPALDAVLPSIPCMPIPYAEASLLLAHLAPRPNRDGETDGERHAVPTGPGPARVAMELDQPLDFYNIHNVIARLRGKRESTIIAGNHRDSWVRGAHDAGGGTVSLLRAAQHLGARAKKGWQPEHTITLCFWDAEEFGLIGSTEWVESRVDWLREHGILYVNADAAVSGIQFSTSGTPGLLGSLTEVLKTLEGPEANEDLAAQWQRTSAVRGRPSLDLPGSGSDFASFLHHVGLPVLDISFRGRNGGQYHTAYDTFEMMEAHLDPGWVGHELCGQFLAAYLAAGAQRGRAMFDAHEAAARMQTEARLMGTERTPNHDSQWFGPERAKRLEAAFTTLAESETYTGHFYQDLQRQAGLPGRRWFRNLLWAPGLETGYRSETFPTLRHAAASGPEALDEALQELIDQVQSLAAGKQD